MKVFVPAVVLERLVGQRFAIAFVIERGVVWIVEPSSSTRGLFKGHFARRVAKLFGPSCVDRSRMTGFAIGFIWLWLVVVAVRRPTRQ